MSPHDKIAKLVEVHFQNTKCTRICQYPIEEGPNLILRNPFEITTQIMKLSLLFCRRVATLSAGDFSPIFYIFISTLQMILS